MPPRRQVKLRCIPVLEMLELRLAPAGTVIVPLDQVLDEFGDQIITVQGYQDDARAAFGIFDTGASAVTFSAGDQAKFIAQGDPIPIKVPGGAIAQGLGGSIVGDVSQPGTILVDGLHAASLSFDSLGHAQFAIQFGVGDAATKGIQAFIGTSHGSPMLPTISGMPILDGGLAALIQMQGAQLDFSQSVPGLIVSLPDLSFVPSGTILTGDSESQPPVRIALTLSGFGNYASPGISITEARVPFQTNVSLFDLPYGSLKGQSFLFDTGAQVTIISTRDAQALGLDLQHPQFTTLLEGVGGSQRIGGYAIPELDLPTTDGGSVRFINVPVFVADLAQGLDGVLGMNLFDTATTMLYDPFAAGGASVSFTFSKSARVSAGAQTNIVSKLDQLGVPFAGTIDGSQVPGLNFNTGTISGQVFLDYNGNGIADKNEPGLARQTVFLDLNNSGHLDPGDPTTTTVQNGFYQFTGLAAGSYTVRESISGDFAAPGPSGASATVVIGANSAVGHVNFANLALQPDAATAFVAELYGELLDRAPDTAGLSTWVQKLHQGMSRGQIAQAIWDSPEHRGLEVDNFYQTFLHRNADAAGRQIWVNALLSGLSEAQVEQGFLVSPEYQAAHADETVFLTGLYTDLLGRQPDSAGSLVWQPVLQSGMSRAQVAMAFLTSDEYHLRSLARYYSDFLHRDADPAGQQYWLTLLHSGSIPLEQVGQSLLGSDEFFAWANRLSTS